MRKKQSGLQKLSQILNASSETFMLVALVSLFAIPFVIGANIEPIVKDSEVAANRPSTAYIRDFSQETTASTSSETVASTQNTVTPTTSSSSQVLGVSTNNNALLVTEDKVNLSYFDSTKTDKSESKFSLNLSTNQVFGRIALFTVKNDSPEAKTYSLSSENKTDDNLSGKYVYVGKSEYEIGSDKLPAGFTLNPGEETQVSLMSNKSRNTSLVISVEVINN